MAKNDGGSGLDPEKTADQLLQFHGRRAVRIAATRANSLAEQGDRHGAITWLRISETLVDKVRQDQSRRQD